MEAALRKLLERVENALDKLTEAHAEVLERLAAGNVKFENLRLRQLLIEKVVLGGGSAVILIVLAAAVRWVFWKA